MILKVQIISLLFSFGYGIIFFLLLELNYKFLYNGKTIYRIIVSFLFVLFISLLYFISMLKINNGILHIYFFLSLFTGYLLSFVIYGKINCKKKWVMLYFRYKVGDNMKKKKNKKVKFRLFFLFVFFCSVIGYLSYSFFSNVNKIMTIRKEEKELSNRLVDLQEKENSLNSDIKKLKDPDYVARYAREKYMYSKDGELIIRIPDDE